MKQLRLIDIATTLALTIWGILKGQVTVFYIIYLFWFQEFIRTLLDTVYVAAKESSYANRLAVVKGALGSFFILFIYLVFIVVFFGFILNWGQMNLVAINTHTFLFRNLFFNLSIFLFAIEYGYYRFKHKNDEVALTVFNERHIILHISIIVGAFIHFFILKKYEIDSVWGAVGVIAPFLLLKIFFTRK